MASRLKGVSNRDLYLPRVCSDFYLLEMATAIVPGGPAAAAFERFEREISPAVAQVLEYAIASELKYAHRLSGGGKAYKLGNGVDCPNCFGEYYLEYASEYSWLGIDRGDGALYCPGCETQFKDGETYDSRGVQYTKSVHTYFEHEAVFGFEEAWEKAWTKHKGALLGGAAKAFNEGRWASGFGGKKWGTIAEVLRDYHFGVIKPRTFLDRAWTLQHNNASVFDKVYFDDIKRLMKVLEIQARHDYQTLATQWASPQVASLYRRMLSWERVYARDEGSGVRRVPEWIGTGD